MTTSVEVLQGAMDTVVAIAPQGALAQAADVAMIVVAVAVLAFLIAAVALFRRLSALAGKLDGLASNASVQVGPTLDRVRAISEHVEYVSLAVRKDIRKVNELVDSVTEKVEAASDRMEERIAEFNALMEVVQGEAEEVFIGTASAVRGVQEGARALGRGRPAMGAEVTGTAAVAGSDPGRESHGGDPPIDGPVDPRLSVDGDMGA